MDKSWERSYENSFHSISDLSFVLSTSSSIHTESIMGLSFPSPKFFPDYSIEIEKNLEKSMKLLSHGISVDEIVPKVGLNEKTSKGIDKMLIFGMNNIFSYDLPLLESSNFLKDESPILNQTLKNINRKESSLISNESIDRSHETSRAVPSGDQIDPCSDSSDIQLPKAIKLNPHHGSPRIDMNNMCGNQPEHTLPILFEESHTEIFETAQEDVDVIPVSPVDQILTNDSEFFCKIRKLYESDSQHSLDFESRLKLSNRAEILNNALIQPALKLQNQFEFNADFSTVQNRNEQTFSKEKHLTEKASKNLEPIRESAVRSEISENISRKNRKPPESIRDIDVVVNIADSEDINEKFQKSQHIENSFKESTKLKRSNIVCVGNENLGKKFKTNHSFTFEVQKWSEKQDIVVNSQKLETKNTNQSSDDVLPLEDWKQKFQKDFGIKITVGRLEKGDNIPKKKCKISKLKPEHIRRQKITINPYKLVQKIESEKKVSTTQISSKENLSSNKIITAAIIHKYHSSSDSEDDVPLSVLKEKIQAKNRKKLSKLQKGSSIEIQPKSTKNEKDLDRIEIIENDDPKGILSESHNANSENQKESDTNGNIIEEITCKTDYSKKSEEKSSKSSNFVDRTIQKSKKTTGHVQKEQSIQTVKKRKPIDNQRVKSVDRSKAGHLSHQLDLFAQKWSKRTEIKRPREKERKISKMQGFTVLDFNKFNLRQAAKKKLEKKTATNDSCAMTDFGVFNGIFDGLDVIRGKFEEGYVKETSVNIEKKLLDEIKSLIELL